IDDRSRVRGILLIGYPSTRIEPGSASSSLGTRFINVDFPDPTGPTSATVWPGAILRSMSIRVGRDPPAYVKVRLRNSISPWISLMSQGLSSSLIEGSIDIIWFIRPIDAIPRWNMFMTQPRAIIGQDK